MKIALCFTGQARSFQKGFEYYKKNLLDVYDVDVYIHTWQFDGEKELENLYKPLRMLTEETLVVDADTKYTNTPNPQKYPEHDIITHKEQRYCPHMMLLRNLFLKGAPFDIVNIPVYLQR